MRCTLWGLVVALAACKPDSDSDTAPVGDTDTDSDTDADADSDADCLVGGLLGDLGVDHLLVGAAMEDATAGSAPFDARYQYLAGGLFDEAEPCDSCKDATCTSFGSSCDNDVGCAWWGCWQYDEDPPGAFARSFIDKAEADGQIPWFTYYELLQASGVAEGSAQVEDAATDVAFMHRYLADYRFLLQQIGTHRAFVHIEPDFWGYAEQLDSDAHALPAAVASANPTDCADQENTIAGMGRCMIAMARVYAPNAKVGLHGSAWATEWDVLANDDASFDVDGHGAALGAFLVACGADDSDFIGVDASDRDAGYYTTQGRDSWWDDTNATLPNFSQAFDWSRAVSNGVGRPVIWWQVPVGNMDLNDTTDQWTDNRVDYLFDHPDEVAAGNGAGMLFGAGMGGMTTPETDGGNLVDRVTTYAAAGGQAACPP